MRQAIAKIDRRARRWNRRIGADMYPYIAGGTGLTAVLPPWTAADGKLFDNLADPTVRVKIRAEIQSDKTDWENMGQLAGPDGMLIVGIDKQENKKYVGKRLSEIAKMMNKDWMDAAMDLILSEHRRVETIYFMMSEDNVKLQLQQPWIKIGTDARGPRPGSRQGSGPSALLWHLPAHSRQVCAGRERDVARRSRSQNDLGGGAPAFDSGSWLACRKACYADIAVFDPRTIIDHATYEQPHQLSTGVRYVFVNGVAVVRDGKHTGAKPGQIVRGPGYVQAQQNGN